MSNKEASVQRHHLCLNPTVAYFISVASEKHAEVVIGRDLSSCTRQMRPQSAGQLLWSLHLNFLLFLESYISF